jgi:hypothetical protein
VNSHGDWDQKNINSVTVNYEVIISGRNASYSGQSSSQAARENSGQKKFR